MNGELADISMSTAMANGVYYSLVNTIFPKLMVLRATNALGLTEAGSVETWAIILLILSIPAMAQGQNPHDQVTDRLKLVNEIMGKSDHQRYIAYLEAKLQQTINIPSLESGDPLLLFAKCFNF